MNLRLGKHICLFVTLVLIGTGLSFTRAKAGQEIPYAEEGLEVLSHGPVHEAFAETVEFDPMEGMLVLKAPPEPIEELPPDQIPEGKDIEWIPGYWAWDDEMNDYIWVSGVWRAAPPGREWVPGYWVSTGQGFQWVSGHWGNAEVDETEYLPEPPATVESGPNAYAPSPDHSWIPGSWIWSRGRYVWRPGYWASMWPDWVWVPAHYEWTPHGYIFVSGYWDHVVPKRGILFAPVYFGFNRHIRHGFRYSPFMAINLEIFFDSLFVRPYYNHYYFGDYYDAAYYQRGFYPWFSPQGRRRGFDPIYAHQRWKHRNDRDWERRVKRNYRNRRDHRDARPSRRLPRMAEMRLKGWKTKEGRRIVAKPLDFISKNRDTSWRFKSLGRKERKRINERKKDFRHYRRTRHHWEAKKSNRPEKKFNRGFVPTTVKTSRSPMKSNSRDQAHVKRFKTGKPDDNFRPWKRRDDSYKRGSRHKGSDRVRKHDDHRKKTVKRGRKADDRYLKTEARGRNNDVRGFKEGDRRRQTSDRGKKLKVRGKKSQDRVQFNRGKKQRSQDRGNVRQVKKQKRQITGKKSQDRVWSSRGKKQRSQDRGNVRQVKKQKRQIRGKKSQDRVWSSRGKKQRSQDRGNVRQVKKQKRQQSRIRGGTNKMVVRRTTTDGG
jgi:hypothetical protein